MSLLLTFTFKDKNAQFEGYVICTGKSDSQYFKLFKNVLFELVMYFFQIISQKKHLKKTNSLVKVSFFLVIFDDVKTIIQRSKIDANVLKTLQKVQKDPFTGPSIYESFVPNPTL